MKHSVTAALLSLSFIAVSCYENELQELGNIVDNIESEKIASVIEQVAAISTSINDLQQTGDQLQEYIADLESQTSALEESLDATEEKIEEIESGLKDDMDKQKVQIISTLDEYKLLVSGELVSIESAITGLKKQKDSIDIRITELQAYIDDEIKDTKDWASATFATLENYNALAGIVSGIQAEIEVLNESLTDIDNTVRTKVEEELASATAGMRESIQKDIETVANDCSNAISTAKEEIADAYGEEIRASITALETSMQAWVNTQLADYYTAAQVDSRLTAMESSFETQLESQKTYLLGLIDALNETMTEQIEANGAQIQELTGSLSLLASEAAVNAENIAGNAEAISANAESIRANAQLISANAGNIGENTEAIEANAQLIETNNRLIKENNSLIKANENEIRDLKSRMSDAENAIIVNAEAISVNASDIAINAGLIAKNATAISNNGAAIAQNAQEIEALKEQLQVTKDELTQAYKAAISTAISNLDGKLTGQLATDVAALNSRIDSEVEAIMAEIDALKSRVTACEKDIKSIKTSLYNMQIEISDIQEQVEAILARIQSIEYMPDYSDGKATMYYTNNGKITPGSATFDFEIQPTAIAEELAEVWEDAVTMKAVYTMTRASSDYADLTVESLTAEDGVITVIVSGAELTEDFFLGRISASACLVVSDGNNELASDYIAMIPWTTDVIYVPDAAFKTYLLSNFDKDSDGEISEDEAMDIEAIDLSDVTTKITTLAGIEYMKNLKTLTAAYHSLASLDLSHNNALAEVTVNNNKLKSIDLSGCTALLSLECSGNKLTSLDISEASGLTDLACSNNDLGALNLTNNKALVNLQCSGNNLAALNLRNHPSLETLYCRSNSLAVLNLSVNTLLKELDCSSNNLTTLNLNKNTSLETVYCRSNSLTSLYLNNCGDITMLDCSKNALTTLNLNGCKAVETLNCSDNPIATLDLSALTALENLNCSGNDLVSLDVSANASLTSVDCSDNAALAKLWVKDAAHQGQMIVTKDDATNIFFNTGGLVFPDAALEAYMLANYDDDYDGVISIAEADNVTTVNCANKGVSDLTGLESCTNLVYLNCSNNNIKIVDCHTLTGLESLSCYGNPVEVLDLSNCAALQSIFLQNVSTNAVSGTTISVNGYDQAASLKFSVANTPFKTLSIVNSPVLTDLNVLSNDNIEVFNGHGNTMLAHLSLSPYFKEVHAYGCSVLEGTDVSSISGLTVLDLHGCNLQTLNIDSNPELVTLDCSSNQLTRLNVDNNTGLVTLKVNVNNLTQFKVANNTALETLDVSDNQLSAINVRSNTALKDLRMSNNTGITALNLKNNTALETLYADGLSISEINLVENTGLAIVSLRNNNLLTQSYIDNEGAVDLLIHASHNFDIANSSGTLITTIYERVGTVLYFSGSEAGGVICGSNLVVSLDETSYGWYDATNWCSSYGDGMWYLPSVDELKSIYANKSKLNKSFSKVGATQLATSSYWSSSERTGYVPYVLNFSDGRIVSGGLSSSKYQVRAVHAF